MYDSDCVIVMGSNMAENHPVAFRWPMKAKVEHGAKIIHVDPRFTRTSAVADIYAPVRAGSDIAFLGGVINYVLDSEKWNKDPFFKTFVANYTNAATIINEDFKDTEDLDGVFSGLAPAKGGDAPNGRSTVSPISTTARPGNTPHQSALRAKRPRDARSGESNSLGTDRRKRRHRRRARRQPPSPAWPTIRATGSVVVRPAHERRDAAESRAACSRSSNGISPATRRRWSRRPPAAPKKLFSRSPRPFWPIPARSETTSFAYAVAWTQHTYGVQIIGACALLQLLLGNIGRPGAGVMALRGHASIQGSTDIPTLYHSIHGYIWRHRPALKQHDTLQDYIAAETHTDRLLGQHAEVHGLLPEVDVRRRGDQGERLRLRLAPEDPRRPLAHGRCSRR